VYGQINAGLRSRQLRRELLVILLVAVALSSWLSCNNSCLCHKLPGDYGSPNRVYCQDFSGLVTYYVTDPEQVSERENRLQLIVELYEAIGSCSTFDCIDGIIRNVDDSELYDLRDEYFNMREQDRFNTLSESERVKLIKCGFNTAINTGV
jgi:hypothetical protein